MNDDPITNAGNLPSPAPPKRPGAPARRRFFAGVLGGGLLGRLVTAAVRIRRGPRVLDLSEADVHSPHDLAG